MLKDPGDIQEDHLQIPTEIKFDELGEEIN